MLRDWIRREGLTQWNVAAFVGVSQAAVNRWCNGRRFPCAEAIRAIEQLTAGEVTADDHYAAWMHSHPPAPRRRRRTR